MTRRTLARAEMTAVLLAAATCWSAAAAGVAHAAGAKYYFHMQPVKAGPEVPSDLKAYTGDALRLELASRAEWASDVGPAGGAEPGPDRSALVAELDRRQLRGFDVTARIENLKQDVRDPKPGSRNKQLAIEVQVTVFGTTIPDAKLAFSGDGQSSSVAEVLDRHMAEDSAEATRDVIKDAIKQAVDQAVIKLGATPSRKRGRKR
jgi:hypothetical protein